MARIIGFGGENKNIPPVIRSWNPSQGKKSFAAFSKEVSIPAILMRPQLAQQGVIDYRNWNLPTDRALRTLDKYSPITARIESYGRQTGNQWNYTNRPISAKYLGGTAPGGFVILPPEVGMEDRTAPTAFVPADRTISTSYFMAGPGARIGTGVPSVATGAIDTGWSINNVLTAETNEDSAGLLAINDLVFGQHTTDARTPNFLLDASNGAFAWRSGQSFWGSAIHANTANRTYTFPDSAGTLPLGTGTATQVSYWSATNTITSSGNLTFDGT